MTTVAQPAPAASPRWMIWTGRVLSALPVLALALAASLGLKGGAEIDAGMAHFGYTSSILPLLAVFQLGFSLLYVVPRTAVLGAILMTAYFGGAVATHLRIADPGYPLAIACGIFTWAGLWLRDARVRALLPLRERP